MKNKYFSQKLKDRGKHFASKIILSFILLLTFTVLSPTISANSAFRVENCNKCEEYAQKLGKEIGEEKVHPHKFRRTLATKAIDKGMPIEQVQNLLGHTKLHYAFVNHRKYIC
jgi:integrase